MPRLNERLDPRLALRLGAVSERLARQIVARRLLVLLRRDDDLRLHHQRAQSAVVARDPGLPNSMALK